ncbi:MAG: hydrolase, partial [Coriobacteriia bacterium]|nr:hydrolase [Coriobacteriia bacterium]
NHLDHIGLASAIHKDIPLYAGKKALAVMQAMADYLGKPLGFFANTYQHKKPIVVGDLRITPFIIDHSAFDAYMLLVEAEGESVLYSGDFRATGRKPFHKELECLPDHVDTLICEGTNLGAKSKPSISEHDLEEKAVKLFKSHSGPVFVLQATTNIDRIVTMYRAAKRSNRIFIEDLFMAEVARAAAPSIPNPSFDDVRVFIDRYYEADSPRFKAFDVYGTKKIGRSEIAERRFVLCIRASMTSLLRSLSEKMDFTDGLMVYSMWSGYKDKPAIERFLKLSHDLGLKQVTLHNSGDADEEAIEALVTRVSPKRIIPVHTENPSWWYERYPDLVNPFRGQESNGLLGSGKGV